MEAQANGARSGRGYFSVTVTRASNAAWKAIQWIT
jgi:hypothetical protein